jgi:hypothetical protein
VKTRERFKPDIIVELYDNGTSLFEENFSWRSEVYDYYGTSSGISFINATNSIITFEIPL